MTMLVVSTQYRENYGSADEPYWKSKGGSDYKILGVPPDADHAAIALAAGIQYSNEFSEEYIIGWSLENDDYMTYDEKMQLEYEGEITVRNTLEYSDLVSVA